MRGSGRGPTGGREGQPWAGTEWGVPEYFRSVGSVVPRVSARGSGCGVAGPACSVPLPARGWLPTRSSLSEGTFLKTYSANTPIAPISVGNRKDWCDVPEGHSLAYLSSLYPPAVGFAHHGEMLGFSGMKVIDCGPSRTTEGRRVAECGKGEESLLACPVHLRFMSLPFTSTLLWGHSSAS